MSREYRKRYLRGAGCLGIVPRIAGPARSMVILVTVLAVLATSATASADITTPTRAPTAQEIHAARHNSVSGPTWGVRRANPVSAGELRRPTPTIRGRAVVLSARSFRRRGSIWTRVQLRFGARLPVPAHASLLLPGGRLRHRTLRVTSWPVMRPRLRLRVELALRGRRWVFVSASSLGVRAAWTKFGCCVWPSERLPVGFRIQPNLPQWALGAIYGGWGWINSANTRAQTYDTFQRGGGNFNACGQGNFIQFQSLQRPAIGLATYCSDGAGITEAHILLDPNVDYHLAEAVAHETGHVTGLGHSSDPRAVMYPYNWNASGLGADDAAGLRALYPPLPPETPAEFLGPNESVSVPSGGSQTINVTVRNRSRRTWTRGTDNLHFVDPQGHDLTYNYCGSDPAWINGNAVAMTEQSVAPGGIATFPVHVCGARGYTGPATLRLQYVRESVAHYNPIFSLRLDFRSSERELGGVNLTAWCQRAGYEGASLDGPIRGRYAAYHWYCYRGSQRGSIDVTEACRRDYSNASAYARPLDVDDAYSWRCYASG